MLGTAKNYHIHESTLQTVQHMIECLNPVSVVPHENTAAFLTTVIGKEIAFNHQNISLSLGPGDILIVCEVNWQTGAGWVRFGNEEISTGIKYFIVRC
jgi:hypothetical protein